MLPDQSQELEASFCNGQAPWHCGTPHRACLHHAELVASHMISKQDFQEFGWWRQPDDPTLTPVAKTLHFDILKHDCVRLSPINGTRCQAGVLGSTLGFLGRGPENGTPS